MHIHGMSFPSSSLYMGLSCKVGVGLGKVVQACKSAVQRVFTILAEWFAKVKAGFCSLFRKKVEPVSVPDRSVPLPPFSSQDMAVIALKKALLYEISDSDSLNMLEDKPEDIRAWLKDVSNQQIVRSVKQLNLDQKELFVIPEEINRFTGLTSLSLANNHIEEIPSKIFSNLNNLQRLNLFDNEITEIETESLHGLSHLRVLILEKNRLARISEEAFQPCKKSIKSIDLSNNELSSLSGELFTNFHNKGFLLQVDKGLKDPISNQGFKAFGAIIVG